MDKGICFIINKCNFRIDIIEPLKNLLKRGGYAPWIAEEVSSFNVDMLENRILKPLKNAEFIIVLLKPTGEDKKDANFNVSFEFGYARGINRNVILLFDGDLENLFTDINRDFALSMDDPGLLSKIESAIVKIEDEKQNKLRELPVEISLEFIESLNSNDFETFYTLMDRFSTTFQLLKNKDVRELVYLIINNKREILPSGKSSQIFLSALNKIFFNDRSEISKNFNKIILTNLIVVLNNTKSIEIMKECFNLFVSSNDAYYIDSVIDFLKSKSLKEFEGNLVFPLINFGSNISFEYCVEFLRKLTKAKRESELSKEKKEILESLWNTLINVIKEKSDESSSSQRF